MVNLSPLIAEDQAEAPFISDFRQQSQRLIQTFHDQPLLARQLAPYVNPVYFDGKTEFETPTWNDTDEAVYAMVPGESDTGINGTSVLTPLPQIYKSAAMTKDQWAKSFAGKNRQSIIMTRLRQQVQIKEDIITFTGDENLGIGGLMDEGTLLVSAGPWADDTGANGILDNFQADMNQIVDHFADLGLRPDIPIDIAVTNGARNLVKNYKMPNRASTNLDLALETTNGGLFLASNNLNGGEAPAAGLHRLFAHPRLPAGEAGWGLLSSGIEDDIHKTGNWTWRYGIREKFAPEIVDSDLFVVIKDIDLDPEPK